MKFYNESFIVDFRFFYINCVTLPSAEWAPVCVQHWRGGCERGSPPPAMEVRVYYPREILEILYANGCILGNICAIIGSHNGSMLLC